ncbi:hypothetical protein SDC9_90280 [bioreactor metagenome]|uniref:Uncharacterized protein n=1 Tax=bioreactor metagenome TaxID=1076179 RepID=A0A644ZY98_9ZZZZ
MVEVVDHAHLQQPLGDLLGLHVLGLEGIHHAQAHQVGQFHFQRHGAAVGRAGVAHAGAIALPGFQTVYVYDADGRFHGESIRWRGRPVSHTGTVQGRAL